MIRSIQPNLEITAARFVAGMSSYYFDDQSAIKNDARQDGFIYSGKPLTPGFSSVRQGGECISVMLQLSNGQWAIGDCCAVQYSGAGGRDPLFIAERYIDFLDKKIGPKLIGLDCNKFIDNAQFIDALEDKGKQVHTAIRYGLSQALLEAAAVSANCTKTEIVCGAYQLDVPKTRVPLFAQSGDERYHSVDKMVMRRVDALPHALINNIDEKVGRHGEKLLEYVKWLSGRIKSVSAELGYEKSYQPSIHIDVYGTLGQLYDNNVGAISDYLQTLAEAAQDFPLYVEGPIDTGEHQSQIATMSAIKQSVSNNSENLKIVADEWCNTLADIIEFVDADCCHMAQIKTPDLGSIHNVAAAIMYCKANGVEAYQGGTCNETDLSSKACVHVALACQPERLLVKPGMGFDEGMQIVNNEMNRTLAQINAA